MEFKTKERKTFEKENLKTPNKLESKWRSPKQRNITEFLNSGTPHKKVKLENAISEDKKEKVLYDIENMADEETADPVCKMKSPKIDRNDKNLRFYRNEIPSQPHGDFLKNILSSWADDFDKLEIHHGYIQWLFPLTEHGMNDHAQTLTEQEIKTFKDSADLQKMLLSSYNMMLKFYGFKLENEETGKVSLYSNYTERFYNLCSSPHNFLRITRIIKCLSLLGLERTTYPFLYKLIHLCLNKKRGTPLDDCKYSCENFWVEAVENEEQKRKFRNLIDKLKQ